MFRTVVCKMLITPDAKQFCRAFLLTLDSTGAWGKLRSVRSWTLPSLDVCIKLVGVRTQAQAVFFKAPRRVCTLRVRFQVEILGVLASMPWFPSGTKPESS